MTTPKISLKCSAEEIESGFKSMDVSTLEGETVDNLLKLFPTIDQMDRFGASETEPSVSAKVVELYLKMLQMPCVDKILHVALLKNQFADRFNPLSRNLKLLSSLSTEAIRSSKLRKVLDSIPTDNFLTHSFYSQHHHHHPAPAAPSLSNPLFQVTLDGGVRSKASSSPSPSPSPPLSPLRYNTKPRASAASPPVPPPLPPPRSYQLSLPPRAHLVWNQQFVLESEPAPHYTWKPQHLREENHQPGTTSTTQVKHVVESNHSCSTPPPPPPPPDWNSWIPQHSSYKRVARRHEPKELEMLARELKEKEDLIHASRIEYGYYKLRAAGETGSSIMRDLCNNLTKRSSSTDLEEFRIESEISCLKEAEGLELKSWRQCQKELQDLRTEFDEAIVEWRTSIRKSIEAGNTRDMIDAFLRENELELQNLARFLIEVRTKTENLFYHLEVDRHRRRQPPAYLDEDAPIVGIFLKFVDCFKTTVNELQLERERALHLPKVNLLDAIFGGDEMQLDANHLKNLISFCPSEVQIHMFRHLVEEEGNIQKAREKLSSLLLGGSSIQAKLKLLSVKRNLPAQAENLRLRLTNLLEATKEILHSVELNSVVKLIASEKTSGPPPPLSEEVPRPSTPPTPPIGALRSASYDGRRIAQGLNLKLLYQLRAKSLHDLVKYISDVHPELLEVMEDIPGGI
ncbi:hypothetical protein R1flu_015910 [Riccia fluitans]|uniref:FH2 domain-containing protein n=1 Tax=Riccia fluitans TaxID=41844 RepID=A0ABD1YNG7_9MARC